MSSIEFSLHALERMRVYHVTSAMVFQTINDPDLVIGSYSGRKIYQKALNGYLLRVIVEEGLLIKKVVTIYKARRERYENNV